MTTEALTPPSPDPATYLEVKLLSFILGGGRPKPQTPRWRRASVQDGGWRGGPGGSVRRACDLWPQGHEFKLHRGHRASLPGRTPYDQQAQLPQSNELRKHFQKRPHLKTLLKMWFCSLKALLTELLFPSNETREDLSLSKNFNNRISDHITQHVFLTASKKHH